MEILELTAAAIIEAREETGDPPARIGPATFEPLMRRHERMVLATALRLLGDLEDAKDASQEVFLKLYRHLGKQEAGANLAGWLYRVTVNTCHDMRRRAKGEALSAEVERAADPAFDPHQDAAHAERRAALEMSLRVLSEKERAALVLRDLEGLSTAEVAAILGSKEATVRSQIAKARIKMKAFVERYFRRRT